MALPPNIATPTLVTGKTNQSQVVDVYKNNAAVQDGAAQNTISSVLSGAVNSLFGNTAKGVFKVLESDKFTKDMGQLVRKAIKGDLNSNIVKETLREYKNGALSSILEANGIKDVKLLKDNILKDVGNTVKGIAFGSVKGIVDNVAPGILDQVGIKSFDDCKNVYEQTAAEIRSLKDINSSDVLFLLNAVADVGPVKAADEQPCVFELQPLDDVGARQVIGRGREGDARHARIALVQHRERAVLGAKVVAPLAHAMRFVNRKQRQVPTLVQTVEQAQKARRVQPLGRGIEQRDVAGLQAQLHVLRLVKTQGGVQKRRVHPRLMQRAHLVVHQRNQRRDDYGHPAPLLLAHDGGHLVAQAFAAARGHEHQRIATANHMFDDVLLGASELLVAKDVVQDGVGGRQSGGQAGRQADTLKLIADGACISSARGQFDQ